MARTKRTYREEDSDYESKGKKKRLRKINETATTKASKNNKIFDQKKLMDEENDYENYDPVHINEEEENSNEYSEDEFIRMMEEEKKQNKKKQKEQKNKKITKVEKNQDINRVFTQDKDQPCKDLRYVYTGIFHSTSDRLQIKKVIQKLGGKVTSAVSGKTNVLLFGYKLEDGRESCESSKYQKALKYKNIIFTNEQDFSKKLQEISGKSLDGHISTLFAQDSKNKEKYIQSLKERFEVEQNQDQEVNIEDILGQDSKEGQLWSDKYAPKEPEQILGNPSQVRQIETFLRNWRKKTKSNKPNQKMDSNALLLYGPPGVGKTTSAVVIAKSLGYDCIIQNASNSRNKANVNQMLSGLKDSQTLGHYMTKKNNSKGIQNKANSKCVIIMDEIDGMTGDRGGIGELLKQIKTTQQPIICICNNNQVQALKTLKKYCCALQFKAPCLDEIAGLLEVILTQEVSIDFWNLIDKSIIIQIVESCQGDIRQIINFLQMWLKGLEIGNLTISKKVRDLQKISSKDIPKLNTPFEAAKSILNTKFNNNTDFQELKRLFFTDYNVMGLFIYENYLPFHFKNSDDLEGIEQAIDSIAMGDQVEKIIQQDRDYTLLNQLSYFSTVRPALSFQRHIAFPQFPQFLGRYSSKKKRERLLQEMKNCILNVSHQISDNDLISTLELLSEFITQAMNYGKFSLIYRVYRDLNFDPTMLKDNLQVLMDFHSKHKVLKRINPKKKTSFTRFYKKKISSTEVIKKTKNKKTKKEESSNSDINEDYIEDDFIVPDDYID